MNPNNPTKASSAAADIIKQAEDEAGFLAGRCSQLKPYVCPAGRLTIGWGHTGPDVHPGMEISPERADELLASDMSYAERIVSAAVTADLAQPQYDALVSFVYNVGPGARGVKDGFVTLKSGGPSTMLRKLNAADYAGTAAEFGKWNKGGGKALAGLTTRREHERRLFVGEA